MQSGIKYNLEFANRLEGRAICPLAAYTRWEKLILCSISNCNQNISKHRALKEPLCTFDYIDGVAQKDILMKSQTVCMYSHSLGKKGQYARTNCINFFNKTYQNNLCSMALQIGLFYLMNLNAYKQFGSSSKCQIGLFCATPSIYDWCRRKRVNIENVIFGNTHLKVQVHCSNLTNVEYHFFGSACQRPPPPKGFREGIGYHTFVLILYNLVHPSYLRYPQFKLWGLKTCRPPPKCSFNIKNCIIILYSFCTPSPKFCTPFFLALSAIQIWRAGDMQPP